MAVPDLGLTAVGDFVQVTLRGTMNSQRILSTFGYKIVDVSAGAIGRWEYYEKLRDALKVATGVIPKFLACIASNYTLESSRFQFLLPNRMIFRDFAELTPGARTGNTVAPNLAASIERRSDVIGRTGIGRLQMPGLLAGDIVAGYLSGGYVTLAQALADEMILPVVTAVSLVIADPCLYGRNVSGTPHTAPVIGTAVQGTVRTMHRRTVGLGE